MYIHSLFPAPVFYCGLLITAANLSLYAQIIFAVIKAQESGELNKLLESSDPLNRHLQAEQYGITMRIALATPLWWVWRSISAWRAQFRLLNRSKNQSWGHKTSHGWAVNLEVELDNTAAA